MYSRVLLGAVLLVASGVLIFPGSSDGATNNADATGAISAEDLALARKWAGLTMKTPGKAGAIRASGEQVRSLAFASDEGISDGDNRFKGELLVVRHDDPANIATDIIPVPKEFKVPPQRAVVAVIDPADGSLVTMIFIGAEEDAKAAAFSLDRLGDGRPTEVDVPTAATITDLSRADQER
jgi:hypothetical protein